MKKIVIGTHIFTQHGTLDATPVEVVEGLKNISVVETLLNAAE